MKGSLHTDELMAEVVRKDSGIRTARRVSHVFIMDVPTYPKPLFITDAAVNIVPNARGQGRHRAQRDRPGACVGDRAAEGRDPVGGGDRDLEDSLDDRRRGAVQDGRARPDHRRAARRPAGARQRDHREAAAAKHITSAVAGDADILVVPDMEAGNMLAKELSFLANADAAGIVLGARVPIILTSRADKRAHPHGQLRGRRDLCPRPGRGHVQSGQARGMMPMREPILVINAGSSSIKFSVFETAADRSLSAGVHGQVEGIGDSPATAGRRSAGAKARRTADRRRRPRRRDRGDPGLVRRSCGPRVRIRRRRTPRGARRARSIPSRC